MSLLVSRPFCCNCTHCHLYILRIPRFRGHINLYTCYIVKGGFPFKEGSKSLFSFILNSSSYLFFSFFATRVFRCITLIHQTCKFLHHWSTQNVAPQIRSIQPSFKCFLCNIFFLIFQARYQRPLYINFRKYRDLFHTTKIS